MRNIVASILITYSTLSDSRRKHYCRLVYKAETNQATTYQFKTEGKFANNHLAEIKKTRKTNAYNMKILSTSKYDVNNIDSALC